MSKVTIKHFVCTFYSSAFFHETSMREVSHRDPKRISLPEGAFGFQFFDIPETVSGGEKLRGSRKNFSPRYLKGTAYTLAQLNKEFPGADHDVLKDNMRCNKWAKVVRTVCGNWQLFGEDTVLI